MKLTIVLLVALAAYAASSTIPHWSETKVVKDRQFLERQKQVLLLFDRVVQRSHLPEHVEIAKTYKIEDHTDKYTHPEVVEEFLHSLRRDHLKRSEIFSQFNRKHLQQAIALFKLFYYAKDYETFYKTAVWARQNVNPSLFVYSFSIAILHRPDTEHILLPPIHEVYPYHFFPTETIHLAQYYKQVHNEEHVDKDDKEYHGYTIDSNYSGHYLNLHPEQSLSYFTEDIGLNSAHYYNNLHYPSWMNSEEYGLKQKYKGALAIFHTHEILAHYYLERLSNQRGEVPVLDLDVPVRVPYTPSLVHYNGLEFSSRPQWANLHDYFYRYGQKHTVDRYTSSYDYVKDYERRIGNVADSKIVLDKDGKKIHLDVNSFESLNIFGNLLYHNNDSINPDFYGNLNRHSRLLLGYASEPLDQHKLVTSALQHTETSLRDPIYYQMIKRWLGFVKRYLHKIPSYTQKELKYPGVEITDVEVDKLITYPDLYYSDISNAVFYGPHEDRSDFRVRVRQQRLNHKPFEYKLHVKSNNNQKVVVKTFFGPKYDEYGREIDITENHWNFFTLEQFTWDLKTGENVIERNSNEFKHFQPSRVPGWKLYEQVEEALEQKHDFTVNNLQNWYYWPQRLMLPKGSEEGTHFQLFFYVYPQEEEQHKNADLPEHWTSEHRSYGFPLERPVEDESVFDIPNAYFHEVKVFHQDIHGLNVHHDHYNSQRHHDEI